MGASVWQRDGSGGKTFTTGIKPAEAQDRAPPASRKRVWTREAAVQVCALVQTPPPGPTRLPGKHYNDRLPR